MSNVEVRLNIVNPNASDPLDVGDTFQIEVIFVDVTDPNGEQSVFSGYSDINFDPSLMRVDSIEYNDGQQIEVVPGLFVTVGGFPELRTGTIDNVAGVVDEVGATSSSLASSALIEPVFTLNATVLAAGAITITADAGEDSASEITIFSGTDLDQDGVGSGAINGTTFGSVSATFECFLPGTLIATQGGEQPIETLQIGDLVRTAEGTYQAIKWVGRQTFDSAHTQPHPFRTYPILIKAGALGDGLPRRDLYVSPDHALLIDGLLINAGALTNDSSIIQLQMEQFVYYHIELEQHSLLLAEGTPAESFLPQNQARDSFDNGDEYEQLYPNHNILSLLPMSFPRVSSKRQLPRCVNKRLAQIAAELYPVKEAQLVQY